IRDGHVTGVQTCALPIFTVVAVNQAPSFTPGPSPQILEDAGPQTFVGWATNVKAGPPSESGQQLNFIISNNTNPALFSSPPAIRSEERRVGKERSSRRST